MDVVIEKKKGIRKKHIPYIVAGVAFIALLCLIIFKNKSSTLRIDSKLTTIATAKKEDFNDYVRVNGQVQPKITLQLSPLEGGLIEEIVKEEGTYVKQGDVILRLSNPQLNLQILDSEASLAEKENFLRNTMVQMEQQKLDIRQDVLQALLDVQRNERTYRQNEKLYSEKLISKEEYLVAKEDYELAVKRKDLIKKREEQDSIYRSIQIENLEESLSSMRKNMSLVRQRIENLDVKAPIDGQIGTLDVVRGQTITQGLKIGQINDLTDFKIEASVDEHYIDRVKNDLSATMERGGINYDLKVRKVYPDVKSAQFKTDFVFVGERPENIRTGQTYSINIELGQPTQSIIIPCGAFYTATGGKWIFVVSQDGKTAHRRNIQISRKNPIYYEVTDGLEAGEQVIVSNYDSYGDNEVLIIND